ncbi:hypothetical protein P7C70_g2914, partial [Phenoliferia sp. Uapishka_3]
MDDPDLELAIKLSIDEQRRVLSGQKSPDEDAKAHAKAKTKAKASVARDAKRTKSSVIDLTLSDSDNDDLPNPFAKLEHHPVKDEEFDQLLDEEDKKPHLGMSVADQLAERQALHQKRKSEEQRRDVPAKRQAVEPEPESEPEPEAAQSDQKGKGRARAVPAAKPIVPIEEEDFKPNVKWEKVKAQPLAMAYEKGALRLTRTTGRGANANAVTWSDIFVKDAIVAGVFFFFFVAGDEFYRFLPVGQNETRNAQIIMGRDIDYDPERSTACVSADVEDKPHLKKEDHLSVARELAKTYRETYGGNYVAVYPFCTGAAHTKVAVIKYTDHADRNFLRVLITSCNAMSIDFVGGSNHHFIQDFPALGPKQRPLTTEFETILLSHLTALGCPLPFIRSLTSTYDFSKAAGSLIPSQPGTYHSVTFNAMGLGRLAELSRQLLQPLTRQQKKGMRLEVCTASVGSIKELWLRQLWHLVKGGDVESLPSEDDEDANLPPISIVYPTQTSANSCSQDAVDAASNMGCHAKYHSRPIAVKGLFYDYKDKVLGRLTHQKQLLLLPSPSAASSQPLFLTIGSTNFSEGAMGGIDFKMKNGLARLKIVNYELSIFIRGTDIEGLLAGAASWNEIITYQRPATRYILAGPGKDKPFSSGAWGK